MLTEYLDTYGYCPKSQAEAIYKGAERALSRLLIPGEILTLSDWTALGSPKVLIIANSNIRPDQLSLRPVDCNTLNGQVPHPGKSAMVDPYGLTPDSSINKLQRNTIIKYSLKVPKGARRQHCFYVAELEAIMGSNYLVYYAPVRGNMLHLRIVHSDHIGISGVGTDFPEVPTSDKVKLISAFHKLNKAS